MKKWLHIKKKKEFSFIAKPNGTMVIFYNSLVINLQIFLIAEINDRKHNYKCFQFLLILLLVNRKKIVLAILIS